MNTDLNFDVIVVGGGAAGMMAGIVASENGSRVLIIEKNKRLGEKLRITGGGRCNITNAEFNLRTFLKNFGDSEKYLYSAFTNFGVQKTIDFFEDIGLPIKVEERNRAFPKSNRAVDVVHVLQNRLDKNNVEIIKNTSVTSIKLDGSSKRIISVTSGLKEYRASQYIVASGGASRPETGSTGDGFDWLRQLGHTVRMPSPNITPLAVDEVAIVKSVAGVSVKSARITFYCDAVQKFKISGDILFTHFGVSGPVVLNNSYRVAELLEEGKVGLKIDCFPNMDEKNLDQKVITVLNENGSKLLKNVLSLITPPGLSPLLRENLKDSVDFEVKTSEVNREVRKKIVDSLKNLDLTVEKLMGFEKAVIADGGVSLKEVDTRTFRSEIIDNLFIVGDLLDINRPSGGYSLQLCWTTGYIAGQASSI